MRLRRMRGGSVAVSFFLLRCGCDEGKMRSSQTGTNGSAQCYGILEAMPLADRVAIGRKQADRVVASAAALEADGSGVEVVDGISDGCFSLRSTSRDAKMHRDRKCLRAILGGKAAQHHELRAWCWREQTIGIEREINIG